MLRSVIIGGSVPTGDVLFFGRWWDRRHTAIAAIALLCVVAYLIAKHGFVMRENRGPMVALAGIGRLRRAAHCRTGVATA